MPTTAPRPNGKLMVVESQFFNRMNLEVTIANGMIGRPELPRQHDDAEPDHPRALRHVGGGRDVPLVLQRLQHFPERADAALAVKGAAMIAGAADGSNAEPLGGDGVELAVAMPRDQHLGAVARPWS